jgi:hypothetical protein
VTVRVVDADHDVADRQTARPPHHDHRSLGVVDHVVGRRPEEQCRLARPTVAHHHDGVRAQLGGDLDERPTGVTGDETALDASILRLADRAGQELLGGLLDGRRVDGGHRLVAGHDRDLPRVHGDDASVGSRHGPRPLERVASVLGPVQPDDVRLHGAQRYDTGRGRARVP